MLRVSSILQFTRPNSCRSVVEYFYSTNVSRNMKTIETIGTHDGMFHCDEVLGCAMLKILFPSARIVRTREIEKLNKCDIVIDVGGVYDPQTYRFDHHQRGFDVTANTLLGKKWTIKLSSAGLVFCTFGKEVLKRVVDIDDENVDRVFDKVYENFVIEIDGIDNGITSCCEKPKYSINTNLSARVSHMNKSWNQTEFDETETFARAMKMVNDEFVDRVKFYANEWLPTRSIVKSMIDSRYQTDDSGEIAELPQLCPWKNHYFDLEAELGLEPTLKYVIFNDGSSWRVQAVPLHAESFILRVPLLKEWRGLREDMIDCEGAIFVHGTGFIGGNRTREGALEMARRTLAASVS